MNGDESSSRPDYYSGFELDADTSSEEMSGSDASDGEYGEGVGLADIPVTGFAVASMRRNQDFHEVFPTVPEGDYLIEGVLPPCLCDVIMEFLHPSLQIMDVHCKERFSFKDDYTSRKTTSVSTRTSLDGLPT